METHGLRCWRGTGRKMPRAHTHLELEANFVLRGRLSYLFGGALTQIETGELAFFWGSVPHQLVFLEAENEIFWLTLPLAQFLSWQLPSHLVQAVLRGSIAKEGAAIGRDTALFADWEADLASGDAARQQIAELEIEARLRRLALSFSPDSTRAKTNSTPGELGHVEKMAAFMAQNYAATLQSDDVARAAGVHPNYAMNLFKREFGLSIGEFLLRTRLSQAQRLLVTTDRKILDVAFECGFGSASRFHAAFKSRCGQSPADYRRSLRR